MSSSIFNLPIRKTKNSMPGMTDMREMKLKRNAYMRLRNFHPKQTKFRVYESSTSGLIIRITLLCTLFYRVLTPPIVPIITDSNDKKFVKLSQNGGFECQKLSIFLQFWDQRRDRQSNMKYLSCRTNAQHPAVT